MKATTPFITLAACTAGLFVAASVTADDEARLLAEATVTLVEAIQIAEAHQGGQAFDASLDDDSFKPEYEVDVLIDGRVVEVTVDGVSGEVLKVKEDRDD